MNIFTHIKKWFVIDDPIKDIKKPTDFMHIRALKFSLQIQNAWIGRELGESEEKYRNFFHVLYCFLNVCGVVSCIVYLLLSEGMSFLELGHLYIVLFIFIFVCICRLLFTTVLNANYTYVTVKFLKELHLFYHKDASEYAMKTHKKIHVICHYFAWYLIVQTYCGPTFFNVTPIWNNIATGKLKNLGNSTYEHSVYLYYPPSFDIYRDPNVYVAGVFISGYMSFICSTLFCILDVLLSVIVLHIWGHLKILLYDLSSFPLPAQEAMFTLNGTGETINVAMYSKQELVGVSKKLEECIKYHRVIKEFTDKVSSGFGPLLFFLYMFLLSSGCLVLLECSEMNSAELVRYFPLLVIIFQHLIQVSVFFELIGSTSEKLKDAVYGVPWESMDTKNRRTVVIFMVFVQNPIHVKALGLLNVGVTTMATVIKTSLSYFAFLRSMSTI